MFHAWRLEVAVRIGPRCSCSWAQHVSLTSAPVLSLCCLRVSSAGIPERVVHATGAGAHGYFEAAAGASQYSKAKVFSQAGKRTPVFARFSTVGGERGSADTARDPRGFAIKHYTEEGIWSGTRAVRRRRTAGLGAAR